LLKYGKEVKFKKDKDNLYNASYRVIDALIKLEDIEVRIKENKLKFK